MKRITWKWWVVPAFVLAGCSGQNPETLDALRQAKTGEAPTAPKGIEPEGGLAGPGCRLVDDPAQRCCSAGLAPTWWCPSARLTEQTGGCGIPAPSGTEPGSLYTCAPDPDGLDVTLTPYAQANRNSASHHWEADWSLAVRDVIRDEMLGEDVPSDVKDVCPRFFAMTEAQKREFWAYFFQSVAVAESSLSPTDRFRESGIPGKDSVTGRPIYSEGLLQLSYQDGPIYGCSFDWGADKRLGDKNPDKTIFDPIRNLQCGVKILHRQIITKGKKLFPSTNWYWSTLTKRSGNSGYQRVMQQLRGVPSFCKD